MKLGHLPFPTHLTMCSPLLQCQDNLHPGAKFYMQSKIISIISKQCLET